MAWKCMICNKKIETNFFGNWKCEFVGGKKVCHDCVKNIPSLKEWDPYASDEQREKQKEKIINEMSNFKYSQELIEDMKVQLKVSEDDVAEYRKLRSMSKEEKEEYNEKKKEKHEKFHEEMLEVAKNHICTNSFNIEGHKITKYIQVVTEEVVVGTGAASAISSSVGDFIGGEIPSYSNKMAIARETATKRAVYKSALLGGNALIGVTVNYVTFDKDVIGVSVTGTSVTIEPIEVGDITEDSK